jgi:hypothetical protein
LKWFDQSGRKRVKEFEEHSDGNDNKLPDVMANSKKETFRRRPEENGGTANTLIY